MSAEDWTCTADLYDEYGDAASVCDIQFHSYGGRRSFAGEIVTVRSHEDNVIMRGVLSEPGRDRVLVVDASGSLHVAMMGDEMALLAVRNCWAGVIIHGAIRDAAPLREIDLGVFALGSNPRKSGKQGIGRRDVPIAFGSVVFRPGERVYADDDGVLVLS